MVRFLRTTLLWILLLPVACTIVGAASNQLVLIANHDRFPVMENIVRIERDVASGAVTVDPRDGVVMLDGLHCLMSDKTRLNFLADIFDFHDGIKSIGDLLLDFGSWLWTFCPFVWGVLVVQRLNADVVTK